MNMSQKEAGTLQVLLQRLNDERLPHALAMKAKVERGECLDDFDVRFLRQVFEDVLVAQRLAQKHVELQELFARLTTLYCDITDHALENERHASGVAL
jgi:hypothetical protein